MQEIQISMQEIQISMQEIRNKAYKQHDLLLNYDDVDDDGFDDEDDCSVSEAASPISPVQENTSDDHYGPYRDNSPTCTPYLDHVGQTNYQKVSILILF